MTPTEILTYFEAELAAEAGNAEATEERRAAAEDFLAHLREIRHQEG
jgi:hypothetical protein